MYFQFFSTMSTFLDPGAIAIMKPSFPYILKSIMVSKVQDQKRQSHYREKQKLERRMPDRGSNMPNHIV